MGKIQRIDPEALFYFCYTLVYIGVNKLEIFVWSEAITQIMNISLDIGLVVCGVLGFCRVCSIQNEKQEYENRLRVANIAFNKSHEGIIITDKNNNIIEVNNAFTKITGYSKAEVIGRNPRFLKSYYHDEDFYKRLWKSLKDTSYWQGEIWNKHKSGKIYPQCLSIYVNKDKNGKILQYIAIFYDLSEQIEFKNTIELLSYTDILTHLPNRMAIMQKIMAKISTNKFRCLAILMLDIDRFKNINDSLGHVVGDELLKLIAGRLRDSFPECDISRLGGDEFLIVLDESYMNRIVEYIKLVLKIVSDPCVINKEILSVNGSVGVSFYPEDGTDPETLVRNADTALHYAKCKGRNTYALFEVEMYTKATRILRLENTLKSDMSNWAKMVYQPQVCLKTNKVVGVEALLRLQHPVHGNISPQELVQIAEESNSTLYLEKLTIQSALEFDNLLKSFDINIPIAVNVSAVQMKQSEFFNRIKEYLKNTNTKPECLELEITESVIIEDYILERMEKFNQLGIRFTLDDFGTGYSSLNYLHKFSFHKIKIDRSFITNLEYNEVDREIIKAVITLAKGLKVSLVAEGVETDYQLKFLKDHGCDLVQGYYFSKPLDESTCLQYIKNRNF